MSDYFTSNIVEVDPGGKQKLFVNIPTPLGNFVQSLALARSGNLFACGCCSSIVKIDPVETKTTLTSAGPLEYLYVWALPSIAAECSIPSPAAKVSWCRVETWSVPMAWRLMTAAICLSATMPS